MTTTNTNRPDEKRIQALQNELKKTQTFPKYIQKKYTNTKYVNQQPQPRNRNWNQHETRSTGCYHCGEVTLYSKLSSQSAEK